MNDKNKIQIEFVRSWHEDQIVQLYRAAGWWKEEMDAGKINHLIQGSFLFAVAIDISTGRAVGMGRVISDGIADAYIQDLVVQGDWRSRGVGTMILIKLLEECKFHKISWIGLIAEPGKEEFYRSQGFAPMPGHVPMLFAKEAK
ncbi:MAG: GNAT family N-acetyltransferase [Methanotrichaceae archaeon]|nr:GNAT family N-acetyltransferase [Methanotrichaceae archaeon]